MRIVLDVDGVLADFVYGALKEINDLLPVNSNRVVREDVVEFAMENLLPPRLRPALFERFSRAGFCAGLYPLVLNCWAVDAMRANGHDIVIATSPWKGSKHWIRERTAWLEQRWHSLEIHHVHDKTGVRGDIFVDDKPSHVREWQAANPNARAFLMDATYNRAAADLTRIQDLSQLFRFL